MHLRLYFLSSSTTHLSCARDLPNGKATLRALTFLIPKKRRKNKIKKDHLSFVHTLLVAWSPKYSELVLQGFCKFAYLIRQERSLIFLRNKMPNKTYSSTLCLQLPPGFHEIPKYIFIIYNSYFSATIHKIVKDSSVK